MYAVIETGGKQYRVSEGDVIFIEKLDVEADAAVSFDKVIAVGKDDGIVVGAPYVDGATVAATALKNRKKILTAKKVTDRLTPRFVSKQSTHNIMIYAHFFKFGKLCSGFSISGHAGYADYGKDIACASVTSAVELTANGITEILGLPAELNLQENEIRLSLTKESDMIAAQPFLDALQLHLKLLSEEFEKTIDLSEESCEKYHFRTP